MDKHWNKANEKKWQQFWEDKFIYKFDTKSKKQIYSIDTDPPTVSGKMHIGHALSYIQKDSILRFHRMTGKNVFAPFGTDDNGLATERMIEKMKNVKGSEMKRSEFVKLCLDTLEKIRPDFIQDWKNLGVSLDWSISYTTINKHCQKISQRSFIELYKMKRAYRKKTPFMWCPECQTSIAQVEMEDREKQSQFVYIKFQTSLGEPITIATTRPELMPACVAIHVHPDDKRYKKFIGAKANIPFFKRSVDIHANKDVDMEFGSGAVYHCTFGDMDDAEWIVSYKIKPIEVMNKDGTLNKKAGKYQGMKAEQARKAIIADLEEAGFIEKIEPITHVVNVHERCGTEIEILMTEQWFIKYLDLKKQLLAAGKKLNWYPKHMRNRYDNWVKGLKWDWSISRQRFFGVPFPVWYCRKCKNIILADTKELPVDPLETKKICHKCKNFAVGEEDVMDTWATSSLTPQIASELVNNKIKIPFNLRSQGHDIISFWLFNTVVKSQLHEKKNPWKDVMINGWVLDPHGKKMSKSKGNVIEPKQMLEKYPADAMRYWATGTTLGEDIRFQEKDFVTGQKFLTKLWNASKFVLSHIDKKHESDITNPADKWLLAYLNQTIEKATKAFNSYEYSLARRAGEKFFWDFCDFYLEMVKDRLYNTDTYSKKEVESAKATLYRSLFTILQLFAPITPHMTEEIYQAFFKKFEGKESLHITDWPKPEKIDTDALTLGNKAVAAITELRKYKTDNKMAMNEPLAKVQLPEELKPIAEDIASTMKIEKVSFGKEIRVIK
jgi:valyl-tRNA synthetase